MLSALLCAVQWEVQQLAGPGGAGEEGEEWYGIGPGAEEAWQGGASSIDPEEAAAAGHPGAQGWRGGPWAEDQAAWAQGAHGRGGSQGLDPGAGSVSSSLSSIQMRQPDEQEQQQYSQYYHLLQQDRQRQHQQGSRASSRSGYSAGGDGAYAPHVDRQATHGAQGPLQQQAQQPHAQRGYLPLPEEYEDAAYLDAKHGGLGQWPVQPGVHGASEAARAGQQQRRQQQPLEPHAQPGLQRLGELLEEGLGEQPPSRDPGAPAGPEAGRALAGPRELQLQGAVLPLPNELVDAGIMATPAPGPLDCAGTGAGHARAPHAPPPQPQHAASVQAPLHEQAWGQNAAAGNAEPPGGRPSKPPTPQLQPLGSVPMPTSDLDAYKLHLAQMQAELLGS